MGLLFNLAGNTGTCTSHHHIQVNWPTLYMLHILLWLVMFSTNLGNFISLTFRAFVWFPIGKFSICTSCGLYSEMNCMNLSVPRLITVEHISPRSTLPCRRQLVPAVCRCQQAAWILKTRSNAHKRMIENSVPYCDVLSQRAAGSIAR